ncbi:MAG TPA: tripartite tricarboxylate transporter substrate binding protein [Eoetvoesiella sp.]
MKKVSTVKVFLGAIAMAASSLTFAQPYPNHAISMITPFPPGGAADVVLRLIAERLTESFKSPVVVENKGGAGGAIGTAFVARAAPDGYTLLLTSSSTMSINPQLRAQPPYDPFKDFTPIALVGTSPNVLVVNSSLPINSVSDLIAAAKKQPGGLNFASNGIGTLSHLTGELFEQTADIEMLHVPYKGAAPAVADTAGGQVAALFAAYASVAPMVESKKLRALGVTSAKRISVAPDLPTIAESGLSGFESNQWWGIWGPAGLPESIVSKINTEVNKVLQDPEVKKRFAQESVELTGGTPQELTDYLRTDYDKWTAVIKAAGIKAE